MYILAVTLDVRSPCLNDAMADEVPDPLNQNMHRLLVHELIVLLANIPNDEENDVEEAPIELLFQFFQRVRHLQLHLLDILL